MPVCGCGCGCGCVYTRAHTPTIDALSVPSPFPPACPPPQVQLWLPDALEPVASEWEGAVWRDLFSEGGADSSV